MNSKLYLRAKTKFYFLAGESRRGELKAVAVTNTGTCMLAAFKCIYI